MKSRVFVLAICLAFAACGGDESMGSIEIAGSWTSNFGTSETITDTQWGTATVHEYDNEANWAVTQNPADDEYNPSKFNKVVWTEPANGKFYYCIVDFGRETLEEAKSSSQMADASNPSAGGCGGFPWTELSSS